jgi:4-cresol dehydrogenase (hydroxylating) flavoprotein subunit
MRDPVSGRTNTSADSIRQALDAWRIALGDAQVRADVDTLERVATTTFPTDQRVLALILPANRGEVQECLRIANRFGIHVSPVSTGKNWGYGSRVPVSSNGVVMQLSRMNRIVDYNERLGFVSIEPGVTPRQLRSFLRERGSTLELGMGGSSPDTSLIGNTLERGIASGPYTDRFAHVCNFEIVLPTGECIETGTGRLQGARSGHVYRWGVGPYVDGLFTQSNLGVVTRMTTWLRPLPRDVRVLCFAIRDKLGLAELLDSLRAVVLHDHIADQFTIWNDYKLAATLASKVTPNSTRLTNAFVSM